MSRVICTKCGTAGSAKKITKGSILIEIVLWICLIVPGVLYSLWRMTSRQRVCRACGSSDIVPIDSPIGRRLAIEQRDQE